jgi:hypothetical protein
MVQLHVVQEVWDLFLDAELTTDNIFVDLSEVQLRYVFFYQQLPQVVWSPRSQ